MGGAGQRRRRCNTLCRKRRAAFAHQTQARRNGRTASLERNRDAIRDAICGAITGANSDAICDATSSAISDAIAMRSAVRSAVRSTVRTAMRSATRPAVQSAMQSAVRSAVRPAVRSAVRFPPSNRVVFFESTVRVEVVRSGAVRSSSARLVARVTARATSAVARCVRLPTLSENRNSSQ